VREHARILTDCGADAVAVRRESELKELDGLVLPGGESTTIVKLARAFELLAPLRDRIASGLPVYGSCAGMILLADRIDGAGSPLDETFGGIDMTVRRNAFGRQIDSFEADLDFAEVTGGPVHAVFIRAPWVESAADHVEVLASVPDSADAGAATGKIVAVRQGRVLATAFHPELTGDGRVHELFVRTVRD